MKLDDIVYDRGASSILEVYEKALKEEKEYFEFRNVIYMIVEDVEERGDGFESTDMSTSEFIIIHVNGLDISTLEDLL